MYCNNETPEQERILQQLRELFVTVPNWRLRQSCIENGWNLNLCVDLLMSTFKEADIPKVNEDRSEILSEQIAAPFGEVEKRVVEYIKNGYRVMVLMRGPPGVGKSFWANAVVTNYVDMTPPYSRVENFVFSSDDYFRNSQGIYKYDINQLSAAHDFNHKRVHKSATEGLSPIIIDNTNMQLWEMMPYVQAGVENGYLLEIVEPKTPWHNCIQKLSQRNKHGVPANKIRRMMERYEKADPSDLITMLKNTKYTVSLPVLRSLPPVSENIPQLTIKQANGSPALEEWNGIHCDSFGKNAPREQRKTFKSNLSFAKHTAYSSEDLQQNQEPMSSYQKSPIKSNSARDVYSLLEKKLNVWKPYEAESIDFWEKNSLKLSKQQIESVAAASSGINDTTNGALFALIRENSDISENSKTELIGDKSVVFERHSVGCSSENLGFATLRQIYPNKRISGLWDLFQKCNGDIDWAVDILLKEDELAELRNDDTSPIFENNNDSFVCSCSCQKEKIREKECTPQTSKSETRENCDIEFTIRGSKQPQQRPQRARFNRHSSAFDPALKEVKENVENCFVLGNEHYSQHLLKIRNIRSGVQSNYIPSPTSTPAESSDNGVNPEDEDDEIETSGKTEDDMLEMCLGEQLVQQLLNNFQSESSLEVRIPPSLPLNLNVFMPRSLAKQLYLLWVESAYNHLEEERQQMVREDEEFARLLKHPQYSEYKQSPGNLREMLDIEYAWTLYRQDKEELQQQRVELENNTKPKDMAGHLTQIKLCETFPDIPRETLLDILVTTDNNYKETVSILRSTMKVNDEVTDGKEKYKLQQAQTDVLNRSDESNENDSSWSPEDAKRQALREFEEARNLAAHHCQLRAECYQKAKEAIQAGNGGAGLYYSQIANLHKQKIDMYNQRAANCIMSVHKYTQNNPEHLDLHYLHMFEALACLDLFLDRHITSLRLTSRNYKYVFIITGRGKHSAGGVSVIKSKVKSRLEERSLKWNEVNPGLLKVKIFSSSRHSQSFL